MNNPPNIEWSKEKGWPKYKTYDANKKEYRIDVWRDDLEGRWYWVEGGQPGNIVTNWEPLK